MRWLCDGAGHASGTGNRRLPRSSCAAGFTLLELLVVLALIAALAGLALPRLTPDRLRPDARQASWEIAAALRATRGAAIAGNFPYRFDLDLSRRSYRAVITEARMPPGGDAYTTDNERSAGGDTVTEVLPETLSLRITTVATKSTRETASIRFFPDGSSSGGRIEVAGPGGQFEIRVDWLTGRVRIGVPGTAESGSGDS